MNILIVEDSKDVGGFLQQVIQEIGHQASQVNSGEEAIIRVAEQHFDMVILDIYMPGMNGYETGIRLKQMTADRHMPILFITSSIKEQELVKSLEIGDDFIIKPIYPYVIEAKINAHLRTLNLYSKVAQQAERLQKAQKNILREHEVVEKIFMMRFQKNIVDSDNFQYHISSKSLFHGDILLTVPSPTGGLYLAVGDVTGHGLPAAVAGLPAYRTFQSMAQKGFNIGSIAKEMNRALLELLPTGMLLAATLIEINQQGNELTVWSGGMPDAFICDSSGKIYNSIQSQHAPLALLKDHQFSQDIMQFRLNDGDRFYIYTDGLTESCNTKGEMFGEEKLKQTIEASAGKGLEGLLAAFELHTGDDSQDDDLTLVEFTAKPFIDLNDEQKTQRESERKHALPWTLNFDLSPEEIRKADPVPQIIQLIKNALGIDIHQDFISTILSELYNNAVDHGLLELDSSIKATPDGFFEFYNLRSERLEKLQQGSVRIVIASKSIDGQHQIIMTVSDSGKGFNPTAARTLTGNEAYGRGINLLTELCHSVEYLDNGSTTIATYYLDKPA
jgi:serine phosphatase RsbU (regulator of sigma subunit)/anti-sigma regulatory factor (Ser/Thr protein kinase)